MQDAMKNYIRALQLDRKKQRKLGLTLCVLSLFVAAGVFWQLRITGITMSDEPCCGLQEHVHSEACTEVRLICGLEEGSVEEQEELPPAQPQLICDQEEHSHGEDCYTIQRELICDQEHTHDDSCWKMRQVQICQEDHEHDDSCFTEEAVLVCDREHIHDDSCYQEERILSCTQPEHTHGEDCYSLSEPQPEQEPAEPPHVHTEACYETVWICGFDEEHIHTLECYSNPDADVESPGDWESTLPHLTGKRELDLIAVAKSQLGYRESDDNFVVAEDGQERRGITRYGQWYGNPYGQWNAMFVTFCLRYADIDDTVVPGNSGCYAWTARLAECGLLRNPGSYRPEPGDLVFFDRDGNGGADHVGIVTKTNSHSFKTIEGGREECVADYEYSMDDGRIYGFVRITEKPIKGPDEPEPSTEPTRETEASTESTEETTVPTEPELMCVPVTVYEDASYETPVDGAIPMTVSAQLPQGASARAYLAETELEGREVLWAFHFGIFNEDGTLWEFPEPVSLTLELPQFLNLDEGTLAIYQLPEERLSCTMEDGKLTFQVMNDSVYAAVLESAEPETVVELPVTVYEDDSYEVPAEGAIPMKVSGPLPENGFARAYPVEAVQEGREVLWAFHFEVFYEDGTHWEGTEQLTMTLELPQFLDGEETGFTLYSIPAEGPWEQIPSDLSSGLLRFPVVNASSYGAVLDEEEKALSEDPLTVSIFTDGNYEQLLEDAPVMAVTGLHPEGAEVRAYPVELTLEDQAVLWAYHIAVFADDGTLWEPSEPLLVSIQQPQVYALEEETAVSVYAIPEDGTEEPVLTRMEEETLTFQLPRAGVYAAVAAGTDLRNAVDSKEPEVKLNGNIIVTGGTLNIDYEFTLDLAGFTIKSETGEPLFTVSEKGSLTILDSQADKDAGTYNYRVMHSTVSGIKTEEEIQEKFVPLAGRIIGGTQPVVKMTGGTFTLKSGALCEGTGRALEMSGGTARLEGGCIYGFSKTGTGEADFGGAVRATGGTLNITGTVLAKNEAPNGGAIYAQNAEVLIDGGIIAENKSTRIVEWNNHSEKAPVRCGGGGIYCTGTTSLTLKSGYITLNTVADDGYFDGGGGVLISGTTSFTMNGGYITGNEASGGGGVRSDYSANSTFTMIDGNISGNKATAAEGGGVAIDRNGVGNIQGGYITNNTVKTEHWGGGGLFCADGSTLYLKTVLITNNSAQGFGGGVAGCPTGHVYLYINNGYAIFENEDVVNGTPNFVSAGGKQIDQDLCNDFFESHGHKDYFCALRSSVMGKMLGGGAVNWEGSADYNAITIGPDDVQTAERVMGLTANPSPEDKAAAIRQATVFITGNSSTTHGGGILCNGNLVVGQPENIYVPVQLNIQAEKALKNEYGETLAMGENVFHFKVTDSEDNVVAEGTNDPNGQITFDKNLSFKEEGTYTYYVQEIPDDNRPEITFDSSIYCITVEVKRDKGTGWYGDTWKYAYYIESIKVEESTDEGNTWTTVPTISPPAGNYLLNLTGDAPSFTNTKPDSVELTVEKRWADGVPGVPSVTVDLLQDGTVMEDKTVVLNSENGWTYTWHDLPKGPKYTVSEHRVPGYDATYTVESSNSGSGSFWVPAGSLVPGEQYIIVSPDETYALNIISGHENHGFDSSDKTPVAPQSGTLTINGITYSSWYAPDRIPDRSIFTAQSAQKNSNPGIILKCNGATKNTWLLVQNADGNFLKSTSGAQFASFFTLENNVLRGQVNYDWNPNNLRTVTFDGNKFNTGGSGNAKLYRLVTGDISGGDVIVITNTKSQTPTYGFKLTKVDALDPEKLLPDAVFQMLSGEEPLSFVFEDGVYVYDPAGTVTELITGENGKLYVADLPAGTYTLRETRAPGGYVTAEDKTLTFPSDGGTTVEITVEDARLSYVLPQTGGAGTNGFLFFGLLLMAAAGGLWIEKTKHNRERRQRD